MQLSKRLVFTLDANAAQLSQGTLSRLIKIQALQTCSSARLTNDGDAVEWPWIGDIDGYHLSIQEGQPNI